MLRPLNRHSCSSARHATSSSQHSYSSARRHGHSSSGGGDARTGYGAAAGAEAGLVSQHVQDIAGQQDNAVLQSVDEQQLVTGVEMAVPAAALPLTASAIA